MSSFFRKLKRLGYFYVAAYFKFWASIFIRKWDPTIVLITGSSGKTTLLHLIEAQLGEEAIYSHHANSAFGVPFHILGLQRSSFKIWEWFIFFIRAPFQAYRPVPAQKLYIVEADAERPGETELISSLLKPHAVIWLSLSQAHGASYDYQVRRGQFDDVLKAIAFENGYCFANARSLVIANASNPHIAKQLGRTKVMQKRLKETDVTGYEIVTGTGAAGTIVSARTEITTVSGRFSLPALVPKDTGIALEAIVELMAFLGKPVDASYRRFEVPPGRSSVFAGKTGSGKSFTIIDSTYNATAEGIRVMLAIVKDFPGTAPKWLVLGDMLEQGANEQEEHAKLADVILVSGAERVVLVGPRLQKSTMPKLQEKTAAAEASSSNAIKTVSFLMPGEALEYLQKEIGGGEVILFKGARFLEGVVEHLLADPACDTPKLCRREAIWQKRRKDWGL